MNVLGLKITSHDTGAALMGEKGVVAISEERLNRVKHSFNMFPRLSIDYCLKAFGLSDADIDLVVMDQVGLRSRVRMKDIFLREMHGRFKNTEIVVINHHDAHAASAFFCSPFDSAAVLVYDGSGERFLTHHGAYAVETETLYRGEGARLAAFDKTTHLRERNRFLYTFGVGKLYSFLSSFYLGFGNYNEGKMMGLAPYGDDRLLREIPQERWWREYDGTIVCNPNFILPARSLLRALLRPLVRAAAAFSEALAGAVGTKSYGTPRVFSPIRLQKAPRRKTDTLPDEYYTSVAYAGQKVLEEVAVAWGTKLRAVTGEDNLCIAGGVGLNIDANMNFLRRVGFKKLFVQPGASDAGVPLGCALYGFHVLKKQPRTWEMKSASLGYTYGAGEIEHALDARRNEIAVRRSDAVAEETAGFIADGKIVGWFSGGSEYGPRALGNRSILCDARNPDMKDTLNARVKHREGWRPFAASVLNERMREYFDIDHESPFMLLAADVRKEKREKVPSIVHVDGTCRIQSVTPESNRPYYELLKAFEKKTDTPLLLNTSFNLGGDPIVETPKDALDTFLATNMDYLILEDYIVEKKS